MDGDGLAANEVGDGGGDSDEVEEAADGDEDAEADVKARSEDG